jgi:hypothetical protein
MSELEPRPSRRKLGLRVARAFLLTAASGVFWLVIWFLTSMLLANFPNYQTLIYGFGLGLALFHFRHCIG